MKPAAVCISECPPATPASDHLATLVIPALRPDLEYFPAPSEENGAPVWMLRDPLTSRYEKAGYLQKIVLDQLTQPRSFSVLLAAVRQASTFPVTSQELLEFCRGLVAKNLTTATLHKPVAQLMKERAAAKISLAKLLVKNYLYFRIPLLHPDRFLALTLPAVKMLVARPILLLYGVLALLGLHALATRFDAYVQTFPRFYDGAGILAYGLAIAAVKTVHEFTHAYLAKAFGVRVPAMGIAFLVLLPVPYCDVTDGWRLRSRSRRLLISLGGVLAELLIAGICLFAWSVCTDGLARSLFFVLSSVTLAGTLLINLNPAMRYDGYFIVGDLLRADNLQTRSLAMMKWFYRRLLWGGSQPCPEPGVTARRCAMLTLFSVYACLYRFALYVSIALLVYYAFDFKLLGIVLFLVEVAYFLVRPFAIEARELFQMRHFFVRNARSMVTLFLAGLLFFWCLIPLPRTERLPAILLPEQLQILYAPYSGTVAQLRLQKGQTVCAGEELLRIDSEDLTHNLEVAQLAVSSLAQELETLTINVEKRALLPQKFEALARAKAQLMELLRIREQMGLNAALSGTVYACDEYLRNGGTLMRQQEIAKIAQPGRYRIVAYVPEWLHNKLDLHAVASFVPDDLPAPYSARLVALQQVKADYLPYFSLSSMEQNSLAVTKDNAGRLKMQDSYYPLDAVLTGGQGENDNLRYDQTGVLWVNSKPYSLFGAWMRRVCAVLLREWNL